MRIDIKGAIVADSEGWIYELFGLSCTYPKQVTGQLAAAKGKEVDIYINSQGGDIFAGSEIYAAIREYSGKKKLHIVGSAASAASVIACAGPSDIAPTAMVMVHNVSSPGAAGDYHAKEKESEILKKANEAIAAAYVEKTGMTKEEALALMDRETWLSAQDAVSLGLVDALSSPGGQQSALMNAAAPLLPPEVVERVRSYKMEQKKAQAQLELFKLKGEEKHEF